MCPPGENLWRLSGSPGYISIPRIYLRGQRQIIGSPQHPGVVVWSERFVAKLGMNCAWVRIGPFVAGRAGVRRRRLTL
ncbi:hypothetical protein QTP88_019016 [Uroleucon formosanum]